MNITTENYSETDNLPKDATITTLSTPPFEGLDPGENGTLPESGYNDTIFVTTEEPDLQLTFEVLNIVAIIMMFAELLLTLLAIAKLKQWRKNYRNLMLTQISLARLLQRILSYAIFLEKKPNIFDNSKQPCLTYLTLITYFNFVTIFLVFFLIKHMYDSLIVIFVKISKNRFYKVSIFAWLFPVPLTTTWVAFVVYDVFDKFLVDVIFCTLFKWTFTVIGTILYICILRKILKDKCRKFARSLTIITFMLCLIINMYAITTDISRLIRCYLLLVIKYITGFILNSLVLCLYIALISSNFKHRIKHSDAISNYSVGVINKEVQPGVERYSVKIESQIMLDVNFK